MKLIEKCNGSGDCRKTEITGGTMCPSYMATRDESTTTRARANVLREMLSRPGLKNPFDQPEIYEVLDSVFHCKACKSECPVQCGHGQAQSRIYAALVRIIIRIPLRTRLIANISKVNSLGCCFPGCSMLWLPTGLSARILKEHSWICNRQKHSHTGKTILQKMGTNDICKL